MQVMKLQTFTYCLARKSWAFLKCQQLIWLWFSGHYVPQLAQLMVDFNKKEKVFNLKGIAVSSRTIEMIHEVLHLCIKAS